MTHNIIVFLSDGMQINLMGSTGQGGYSCLQIILPHGSDREQQKKDIYSAKELFFWDQWTYDL